MGTGPSLTREAVLQVYAPLAWGRGWFAVHTWIAKAVSALILDLPFSGIGSGYAH